MPPIVTLLTDFGTADSYVAQMKGVILSIAPQATLVDLTHEIPAGDIAAAQRVLEQAAPRFPAGTIHVVVVDPGVGTDKRVPCVVQAGGQFFVGPNNGLFGGLVERGIEAAYELVSDLYRLPAVSRTFHGRDVFAPAAAHIAAGVAPARMGGPLASVRRLRRPVPIDGAEWVEGAVEYADRFGNVISNIDRDAAVRLLNRLRAPRALVVVFRDREYPILDTYGQAPDGSLLALWNSEGRIEIARNGGSAAQALGARVGESIRLAAR